MSIIKGISEKDEKNIYESLHKKGVMDNIKVIMFLAKSKFHRVLLIKALTVINFRVLIVKY